MPRLNKHEIKFLEIVKEGKVENVKTQIAVLKNLGISICFTDEKGRTPLHWAAEKGHAQVIQELIAAFDKAPPFNFKFHLRTEPWTLEGWLNWQDDEGQAALHLATANKHLACVQVLTGNAVTLKQIELKNQAGDTPVAAVRGLGLGGPSVWKHFEQNGLTNGIEQTAGGKLATQAMAAWDSFRRVYRPIDLMRASVKKALAWLSVLTLVYAMIKGVFGEQTRSPNFFRSSSADADSTLKPDFALMASLTLLACVLPLMFVDKVGQLQPSAQNRLTR